MAFPELREDQLRAICERFGLPSGPFGRLPSTGVINAIYTVGEGLVLRVPKNVGVGLRDTYTESVAVPAAVAAGVRTPHLVAFDEACDIVEMPYGVYDRVHAADGEPATDEGWRELGRDLARLHEGVTPASCPDPLNRLDTPGRWTTADDVVASLPGLDEADRAALEPVLRRLEAAVLSWEAAYRWFWPATARSERSTTPTPSVSVSDGTSSAPSPAGWTNRCIDAVLGCLSPVDVQPLVNAA